MRGRGPRARLTEREREGHLKRRSARWREVGEAEVKRDRPSLLQGPRLVQSGTARLLLHAPRGRTTNVDTTTLRLVRRYARGPNFGRVRPPAIRPPSRIGAPRRHPSTATKFWTFTRGNLVQAKVSCLFGVLGAIARDRFAHEIWSSLLSLVDKLVDLNTLLFLGVYSSTIRVRDDVSWNFPKSSQSSKKTLCFDNGTLEVDRRILSSKYLDLIRTSLRKKRVTETSDGKFSFGYITHSIPIRATIHVCVYFRSTTNHDWTDCRSPLRQKS